MPVYLNGVGTAKARNLRDGAAAGRWPHHVSINFKEGQDVKPRRPAGQDRSRHLPGPARPGGGQESPGRTSQLDNAPTRPRTLQHRWAATWWRKNRRYPARWSPSSPRRSSRTTRPSPTPRPILDYTTIVSPIDGRVGIRMVDEGNLVRAADAGLVVITEVRPIAVLFTRCRSSSSNQDQPGACASGAVSVDALDFRRQAPRLIAAPLQVVDNQVDSTTGTIRMKAEFPNSNLQLWPGQFVNVRILIDTPEAGRRHTHPVGAARPQRRVRLSSCRREDKVTHAAWLPSPCRTDRRRHRQGSWTTGERVVTTGFARLEERLARHRWPRSRSRGRAGRQVGPGRRPCRRRASACRTACADDTQGSVSNTGAARELRCNCLQANAAKLSDACKAATAAARGGKRNAKSKHARPTAVRHNECLLALHPAADRHVAARRRRAAGRRAGLLAAAGRPRCRRSTSPPSR